jgi:hypothetical protein
MWWLRIPRQDDAFIYYSNFTEAQLIPAATLLCERLVEPDLESLYVYKKYANKKFLRASHFARRWAQTNAAAMWFNGKFDGLVTSMLGWLPRLTDRSR